MNSHDRGAVVARRGKLASVLHFDTSLTPDSNALGKAAKEVARGDFDLMTVYLAGLDNRLHNGAAGVTTEVTQQFVEASIGANLEAFRAKLSKKFKTHPVFALFSDHGHIPVQEGRRVGFDTIPALKASLEPKVPGAPPYVARNRFDLGANVIFQPEGGIAHVYVAGAPMVTDTARWAVAPDEGRLKPLVDALVATFGATRGEDANARPFAQILVRLGVGFGAVYRAVPTAYNPAQSLDSQLEPLTELPGTQYLNAAARVAAWASENTGDIVLLANMDAGYYLDGGNLTSTHGSLSATDGIVPLAFSYPGATSTDPEKDTRLQKIREYLGGPGSGQPSTFVDPTEANSARCFLGLIQSCRR